MRKTSTDFVMNCVVFAAVLLRPGFAQEPASKPSNESTPEASVRALAKASKAGDLDRALEQIAVPFRELMRLFILEEEADDILRAALDKKFGKQRRVGFRMEVKRDILRIQSLTILSKTQVNENRVKLTVREVVKSFKHAGNDIADVVYLAVREDGQWRLYRPFTALVFGATKEESRLVTEKGPDGKERQIFKIEFKRELDELARETKKKIESKDKTLSELLAEKQKIKDAAKKLATDVKAGKFASRKEANDAMKSLAREISKGKS